MSKSSNSVFESLESRQMFSLTVTPYDPSTPAAALSSALVDSTSGLTVTDRSFTGQNGQAATYSGLDMVSSNASVKLNDGVLLTTGTAANAAGSGIGYASKHWGTAGESSLAAAAGATTFDAAALTVSFTAAPGTNSISLDLAFGTEELPGRLIGLIDVNDVVGIYLDGVQITADSTNRPIGAKNDFLDYDNSVLPLNGLTAVTMPTRYNGLTQGLQTVAPLNANFATHTLKVVIADAGDTLADSGVFVSRLRGSTAVVASPATGAIPSAGVLQMSAATASVANTEGVARVTVTRTGGSAGTATVDYATANGTGSAGTNYTATSGTLTFAAGETSKTIDVPVTDDASAAASATFTVTLTNATGASLGSPAVATVTVRNERSVVQVAQASVALSNILPTAVITVSRTGNTSLGAMVDFATQAGTALGGVDFTPVAGTLTFLAGQTSKTIIVPLLGSATSAATSAFKVLLKDPGLGTLVGAAGEAVVNLTNPRAVVGLAEPTINVLATAGQAAVRVIRQGNTSISSTVNYLTTNGSAIAGLDFDAVSGTLNFAAGEVEKLVNIPLRNNVAAAATTTFDLLINTPGVNTILSTLTGTTVNVVNSPSVVHFAHAAHAYGIDDGRALLTVQRSGNTTLAVSVDYATQGQTALPGVHYEHAVGTLAFAPGETVKTIEVPILADADAPPLTSFLVTLSNPADGAVMGLTTASEVTLANDKSLAEFTVGTQAVSGDAGSATLTVTRVGNLAGSGSFSYHTAHGTAVPGTDYAGRSGTLSFAAGESVKTIVIPILDNPGGAASTHFGVVLSNAEGDLVLGDYTESTITIVNGRSLARFGASQYAVHEGEGAATITVTRTGNLAVGGTIAYAAVPNNGVSWAVGAAGISGIVSFAAGESSATFQIPLIDDAHSDRMESVLLTLSDPSVGISLAPDASTATLLVDDNEPPLRFAHVTFPDQSGADVHAVAKPFGEFTLWFDQPLDDTAVAADFSLYARTKDLTNGGGTIRQRAIRSVSVDPTGHGLTIRTAKFHKHDAFYELRVREGAVKDTSGEVLDGLGTGIAGSDFTMYFGIGRKLSYVDHDGDKVQLKLSGPGAMRLTRLANGEGNVLSIADGTAGTSISGTVRKQKRVGTNVTSISSIVGLSGGKDVLSRTSFQIGTVG